MPVAATFCDCEWRATVAPAAGSPFQVTTPLALNTGGRARESLSSNRPEQPIMSAIRSAGTARPVAGVRGTRGEMPHGKRFTMVRRSFRKRSD